MARLAFLNRDPHLANMSIDSRRLTKDCESAQAALAARGHVLRRTGATAVIEPILPLIREFRTKKYSWVAIAAALAKQGVVQGSERKPITARRLTALISAINKRERRRVIENRVQGEVDPKMLLKIAAGATVSCLMNQVMDEKAAAILQAGGLASIAKLDAKALNDKFGVAQGSRIRRDLTRVRLEVMQSVRLAAEWLIAK